ncbi:MAG: hypothetical protein WCB94_02725 [Terriglobales bacterium]
MYPPTAIFQLPDTGAVDALHKEWPVIKAAPWSFFSSLGILIFIITVIIWSIFHARFERYKEEIDELKRYVERLEKGRHPRPVKLTFFARLIEIFDRGHPQNARTLRDTFSNPRWNVVSKHRYENHSLEVDGNSYQDCSFKNVTFIFHGTAPFEFRGKTELDKGEFAFHSDDPAIQNFEMMKEQFIRLSKGQVEVGVKDAAGNRVAPPKLLVVPAIVKVADWIEDGTADPKLGYPLKLRIQFRNDSPMSVAVRMSEYTANLAPAKEPVPSAVLQVKLGGKWLPAPNAEEQIAVAPTQHFRAWVGIDHKKTSAQQLEEHKGQLGTLALLVNGEAINFEL